MKTALLCGPIVRADGPVPSHLYVLGERAGEEEHDQGVPFVGEAGRHSPRVVPLRRTELRQLPPLERVHRLPKRTTLTR